MAQDDKKQRGLGRGLSALLGDEAMAEEATGGIDLRSEDPASRITLLALDEVEANADQPRREFDSEELNELAESIRRKGVIQPIIVRQGVGDKYEIVAGERRWRAAQLAHLHEIPALIRDMSDQETLEIAIIENVQRVDLNPIEEASGYEQLISAYDYTQADLAQTIGKSRSHIANTLRLMKLPDEIKQYVRDARLSPGHARTLINAENPLEIAQSIMDQNLNVREAERLAARAGPNRSGKRRSAVRSGQQKDADTLALEGDISAALGMAVSIDHATNGGGAVRIRYDTLEDLDEVCRRLCIDVQGVSFVD